MTMITKEALREAAHKKVDEADEAMLISILEILPDAEQQFTTKYSEEDLRELHEASQSYKKGDGENLSDAAFWHLISEKTGYQRQL